MLVNAYTRAHGFNPKIGNCISELESLAVEPQRLNELNDLYEMVPLVENIKLTLYEDYKSDEPKFRD